MVAQRISRRTVVDWDRQRQPPAQAVQLCDEMGRQRAAVARSKRPHVGVPGTERRPLPNALGGERRGDAIFAAHALLHQEFPLPMGRFRVFLFHGRHDHGPAGTGIAGKLCGQDAKEPDSVQPVGFSAPGASGDQDAGRLDNVVDHAVGGQKSMQPKSIPPGLKAADDTHRRVIRRIQPVAQAGDESKQSCAVARFQTMKLSLGSLALEA
jgi:hypothetical protein